jgi:hypothetical protein
MKETGFGKDAWVSLFREIGLDEPTMHRWHVRFEAQWPDAHQSFLEWLGIGGADIERIRKQARSERT